MMWGDILNHIYEILKQVKETGNIKTLTTVATQKMTIDPITVKELKVELAAIMNDAVPFIKVTYGLENDGILAFLPTMSC